MKNQEKGKSKIAETITQSTLETDETELMTEQGVNMKIAIKFYQEQTRPYFSSPCMLSEMEDKEDMFNFKLLSSIRSSKHERMPPDLKGTKCY